MPKKENPNKREIIHADRLKFLLSLFSIEGLICIIWLLLIPRGESGIIFGFSLRRLLLISIPLLPTIFSLTFFCIFRKKPESINNINSRLNITRTIKYIFPFSAVLSIGSWSGLFFYHLLNDEVNPFINQRLLPISVWITITSLSLIIFLPRISGNKKEKHTRFRVKKYLPIFLLTIILFGIIYLTGLGLHTKDVTVNDLGVPLLEWQILYICGLMIILIFTNRGFKKIYIFKEEKQARLLTYLTPMIFVFLWLTALIVWVNLPLPNHNYFAPEKLPPNFETYPFSDAERYSLDGQRIISGAIDGFIISKPLHAVFLAIIHSVAGLDYGKVITAQTIILALFPAVLYLIGKEIHGNILGLGMGLFAIFREVNAIQASDIANVSNSKLLMSDFTSMLILSVLILINIRWIKKPYGKYSAILQGGTLGALVLYRAQYLVFLPFYLVMAFVLYKKEWKSILVFGSLFLLCVCIVNFPVLIRNHSISGRFWFDSPKSLSYFREYYMLMGSDSENPDNVDMSASVPESQSSPLPGLLEFILKSEYPIDIVDNISRNLISTFLVFPIRYEGKQTLKELSIIEDNFWAEAYSYNKPSNAIIAIVNLLILAIGLTALINNNQKIGYVFIAIYFLINFSAAIFRFSGWRFIMPIDWMSYMVLLSGIFNIIEGSRWAPKNEISDIEDTPKKENPLIGANFRNNLILMLLFLLIGSLIPLRELLPASYRSREKSEICANIEELINNDKHENIKEAAINLCQSDLSTAVEGKVIHPRFFREGWGFYDRPDDIYFGEQDFSRLVFRVLNRNIRSMYILIDDLLEDTYLPNGANAIIIADKEEYPQAQFLVLTEVKNEFIYADGFLNIDE